MLDQDIANHVYTHWRKNVRVKKRDGGSLVWEKVIKVTESKNTKKQ